MVIIINEFEKSIPIVVINSGTKLSIIPIPFGVGDIVSRVFTTT